MDADRKYDSAPARMRKREVANTWDIQQTAAFFAPPSQPTEFFNAPTLPVEPPPAPRYARAATLSGVPPRYARGNSAEWNAHGSGSWGRISKRRTNGGAHENSMSLWEVSEALKTAAEPPPTLHEVSREDANDLGLGLLDELVALEAAGQDVDITEAMGGGFSAVSHPADEGHCEGKLHPDDLLEMLEDGHDVFAEERDVWCATGLELPETAMFASCLEHNNGPASPSPTSVTDLFCTPPKYDKPTGDSGKTSRGDSQSSTPPHVASICSPPPMGQQLSLEVSQRLAHEAAHHAAQHHANQMLQQQSQSYEAAYQGAYQAAFQAAAQATNHAMPPSLAPTSVAVAFSSPTSVSGVFGAPTSFANPVCRNGAERKEWTPAEDAIIRQSMIVHGARWRRIAAQLPGRSDDAVRNRWNRLKLEEGAATNLEAPTLIATDRTDTTIPPLMKRNSSLTSTASEGASPSCKPERVSWTRVEDATILQSVQELGHKWNKLAERLPGRTDHAIRNRFHRLQTMLEDKQREQQRGFAPVEPLPESTLSGHCANSFVVF